MERLTTEQIKQFCNTTFGREVGKHISRQVVGELLFYRQLEEEIGCPLEVLFRALKDGIYAREDNSEFYKYKKQTVRGIELNGLSVISENAPYPECDWKCYYKDYKKTWFLKEDRSE